MRTLSLAPAVFLAVLASGEARACRCVQGVTDRLYQNPGAARVAVLLRSTRHFPEDLAVPTGPGWVEVETHPLRGKAFQRYRWGGTSCDLRVPVEGWYLLLTQGDPERGLSMCDTVLVPLDDAGPLISLLLPGSTWTACRADAECAASTSPGCLPPLTVRRDALQSVKSWRREVARALRCGDAPTRAAGEAPLYIVCAAGTCGFAHPPGR